MTFVKQKNYYSSVSEKGLTNPGKANSLQPESEITCNFFYAILYLMASREHAYIELQWY